MNNNKFGDDFFIAISGIIGAGKSTLAEALGQVTGLPVFYEPVIDNAYLVDFYRDMQRYSFQLQIYLLNRRFQQQQHLVWSGRGGIQDRSIYEDSVFATMLKDSGLMEQRDYDTYMSLFRNMSNFMRRPSLIVHLDVTPQQSLERIKQRGRAAEQQISEQYLVALSTAYERFLLDISKIVPVIRVDWNKRDNNIEAVAQRIKHEYEQLLNVKKITAD